MGLLSPIIGILTRKLAKSAGKYIVETQAFLLVNSQMGSASLELGQMEAWITAAILTGLEFLIDFLKEKFHWKWL